jgi:hypothetical protein
MIRLKNMLEGPTKKEKDIHLCDCQYCTVNESEDDESDEFYDNYDV